MRASKIPVLLTLVAACSADPERPDGGLIDAGIDDAAIGDAGIDDSGIISEFCMASTPPSALHEGRCRTDDGEVDENATGICLLDRDYMEFF